MFRCSQPPDVSNTTVIMILKEFTLCSDKNRISKHLLNSSEIGKE